jgi:hypothetical protein
VTGNDCVDPGISLEAESDADEVDGQQNDAQLEDAHDDVCEHDDGRALKT